MGQKVLLQYRPRVVGNSKVNLSYEACIIIAYQNFPDLYHGSSLGQVGTRLPTSGRLPALFVLIAATLIKKIMEGIPRGRYIFI